MKAPVIRPNVFAPTTEEPVVAPADRSFTGRLGASFGRYSMASNLSDSYEMRKARENDVQGLDITDDDLLRNQRDEDKATILQEKATYGVHAASTLAAQIANDRENEQVTDGLSLFKGILYGGAAMALDPTSWLPVGTAAKAGIAVGAGVRSLAAKVGMEKGLGMTQTAATWAAVGAAESAVMNAPRLTGDHTYAMDDFMQDVMVETAFAGTLGVGGKLLGKGMLLGKKQHVSKQARLDEHVARRERELNGDWSNVRLNAATEELDKTINTPKSFETAGHKEAYADMLGEARTLKMKADDLNRQAVGDKFVVQKEQLAADVEDIMTRVNTAPSDPATIVSVLDDLRVMTGNINTPQAVNDLGARQLRATAANNMRVRLKEIVADEVDGVPKEAMGKLVRSVQSLVSRKVLRSIDGLAESAVTKQLSLKVAKLDLYYGGKIPKFKLRLMHAANDAAEKGDTALADSLLTKASKDIPEQPVVNPVIDDAAEVTASAADVAAVKAGYVSVSDIKVVLDELPEEIKQGVKGTNAVFGRIDDDAVQLTPDATAQVASKLVGKSARRVARAVRMFQQTGEKAASQHAAASPHVAGFIGHHAGRLFGLTKDMASELRESKSEVLNFLGTRLLELGKGYGGVTGRRHTAAVIKEAELTQSLAKVLPQYYRSVKEWAASKGESAISAYNAANKTGFHNDVANAFNREFMSIMNKRNLGKDVGEIHPAMQKLVNDWNNYMAHNHSKLVSNGVEGFSADRVIKSYVPQVWHKNKMVELVANGKGNDLKEALMAGYRSAGNKDPEAAADALLSWVKKPQENTPMDDPFMPKVDSRAQERTAIDWDAEYNGMKVMDMLDTEAPGLATKYSNRMAGWVGIRKSTDGAISNGLDINVSRDMVKTEMTNAGKSKREINKALDLFDDSFDLLFGRPTRGGLADSVRNMKELAVLARMGGLGMAQAAESGVVATRTLMEASQSPAFMKKVFSRASTEDIDELVRLSGYDADYALLNRQSVNLDVAEGRMNGRAVNALNKASDYLTFGSGKAAGMRALGQVTGYDAIRKAQSYVAQRSFGMSVARHFNGSKSKLSNGRLADWGLTDANGKNDLLKAQFDNFVEFDAQGYPVKYNFDKWDSEALDTFRYSMQRMEAQTQARALAGELPTWMNKPYMTIIMQFRQMAITTNNKTLARNMNLADQEAIAELTLATMSASAVRIAKLTGLSTIAATLSGVELEDELSRRIAMAERDKLLPFGADMYINHFGVFSDVYNTTNMLMNDVTDAPRQVPIMGMMEAYMKTGGSLAEGDVEGAFKNFQRMAILGNTAVVETLSDALFQLNEE